MIVFDSIREFMRTELPLEGSRGFVPTMGALHEGHRSLIQRSLKENQSTVVSIFINPTQFDRAEDLKEYPESLSKDKEQLNSLGVDLLLIPTFEQMYPDTFRYEVTEKELSSEMCGAYRSGHFTGVLTVVMKLLNIVRPNRAYFGEKDYQQYLLIRDMVEAFFLDVDIIACPTVRDPDGLALSSRNLNLSGSARVKAPKLHELMRSKSSDNEVRLELAKEGFEVEYVQTKFGRRFVAARIASHPTVRLIDNIALTA